MKVRVWRKQTVRWTLRGKRVEAGTPRAKRNVELSKRFYGTLKDADGRRQQVPLCEDREASETLLRRLQTDADRERALGVPRHVRASKRPLDASLDEFATYLRNKANTEKHVEHALLRIRSLLTATKAKTLDDLDALRLANTLAAWRQHGRPTNRKGRKPEAISVSTSNHYVRAIKGFSRWLWMERKSPDDALSGLRLLNANADRRRQRRAFTPDELKRLTEAAKANRKRLFGLTSNDRAMLYTLAAYTGLRASELASLTKSSFDLQAMTVSVQAAYSKRRRNDTLPLHASLIGILTTWLASKGDGLLWRGTWANTHGVQAAKMLKRDMLRAKISYQDDAGRYADFHALRHTFISSLARSGVHPSKAKELARHSTITLTMDVYSHVSTEELRTAVDTLPAFTQ